ncbi:MAG: helix-turn-helix domain-containing protein [Nanoarchaeota archaeon]|nr:helix-turn-helix domain-containing protein [Nanoarchaeota archaeon]
MWAAKIIIPAREDIFISSRAKRHKVAVMGYPLSNFFKKRRFFVLVAAHIQGEEKAKTDFVADLKKDWRTEKIDMVSKDFGFWLMEQDPPISIIYDPMIIYPTPLVISNEGIHHFEIASWEREKLVAVAQAVKKHYGGTLAYLKKQKIKNIAIMTAMPRLTDKQHRAIELAISHGYYGYPRKTEIAPLAKLMNVSYSTYQFHLRNAEKKLMPYVYSTSL